MRAGSGDEIGIKNAIIPPLSLHYPRLSTGALPLTKKPVDSGYEIESTPPAAAISNEIPVSGTLNDRKHSMFQFSCTSKNNVMK